MEKNSKKSREEIWREERKRKGLRKRKEGRESRYHLVEKGRTRRRVRGREGRKGC